MNKMNKKGFTLIEMLVVIAIIAVLVSIVVPVVGNSNNKARGAADAANLRSYAATAALEYLEDGKLDTTSYDCKSECYPSITSITISESAGTIVAKFGTYDIAHFANIAKTGTIPALPTT